MTSRKDAELATTAIGGQKKNRFAVMASQSTEQTSRCQASAARTGKRSQTDMKIDKAKIERNLTVAGLMPLASIALFFVLLNTDGNSMFIQILRYVTLVVSLSGYSFFFLTKRFAKGNKTIRILGILDIIATFIIMYFYVVVILIFGL